MFQDPTAASAASAIFQKKIKELKEKLKTAIDLAQMNLSAFQKFKHCSHEIQSTKSLDYLPGVLESIKSRLRLQDVFLVLAEEDYSGFVPLSIRTKPKADLKALMTDMGLDAPGIKPVMGSLTGIRQAFPGTKHIFPDNQEAGKNGSVCIFFLADKYHQQAITGVLCLVDKNVHRFCADMATDFIEYFADSFAWTMVTLREHEKLIRENTLDQLTGCHNRTYFCKHAPRILEFAQRKGFPVALLFVDMDKFKAVNDSMGHACGDLVLIAIAERIRGIVREYDIFIRLGGDEFLVLLPDVDQQTALDTAKRIQKEIQSVDLAGVCGQKTSLKASVSVGVAMCEQGESLEQLIARADKSMYSAKNDGR